MGRLDLVLSKVVRQDVLLHLLVLIHDEVLHLTAEPLQLIDEQVFVLQLTPLFLLPRLIRELRSRSRQLRWRVRPLS